MISHLPILKLCIHLLNSVATIGISKCSCDPFDEREGGGSGGKGSKTPLVLAKLLR